MNHSDITAREMIEASYHLGDALRSAGYSASFDLTRVVLRFPDCSTLYRFERELASSPLLQRDSSGIPDWKRDENGYIFKDIVIAGIPWRLTSDERTLGYPIIYAELPDMGKMKDDEPIGTILHTVTFDPDTHYVAEREPGVRRAG